MTSLNEGEMPWESVISLLVQRVMVCGYFRELGNLLQLKCKGLFFVLSLIPIRELYYPWINNPFKQNQ
jgi:hypothetical protein